MSNCVPETMLREFSVGELIGVLADGHPGALALYPLLTTLPACLRALNLHHASLALSLSPSFFLFPSFLSSPHLVSYSFLLKATAKSLRSIGHHFVFLSLLTNQAQLKLFKWLYYFTIILYVLSLGFIENQLPNPPPKNCCILGSGSGCPHDVFATVCFRIISVPFLSLYHSLTRFHFPLTTCFCRLICLSLSEETSTNPSIIHKAKRQSFSSFTNPDRVGPKSLPYSKLHRNLELIEGNLHLLFFFFRRLQSYF